MRHDVPHQALQLSVIPLKFQPLLHPVPRLLPPAHLHQTLTPPPPRLGVADPLHDDTRVRVGGPLRPLLHVHVRLRPVRQQHRHLVLDQRGGLPPRPAQRHVQAVAVQLDGLGRRRRRRFPEYGVALLAHLLDLGRPFGVQGQGRRRDLGGGVEVEEGAVQLVEGGEFGDEGGVCGGGEGGRRDGFAAGVEVEREKGEGFVHSGRRGIDGLMGFGVGGGPLSKRSD